MAKRNRRAEFSLSDAEISELRRISRSRTAPLAHVERARILLAYHEGLSVTEIARRFGTSRPRVERTIDRAIRLGAIPSLSDLPRRGRPARISPEAKHWIVSLACTKPKELGYAAETWTLRLLCEHVRSHCEEAGYPELVRLSKGTVSKLLSRLKVRPHKIRYYVERRDPEFERKMAQVLHVYQEVDLWRKQQAEGSAPENVVVLSYDEKPGIQAIQNVGRDLPPVPGKRPQWNRDYEYRRLGTVSLLASIDLLTGHVHAHVQDRHRSREFIEHLRHLDAYYPPEVKIKIILDNHSSHISKETQAYLQTVPNRFEFIFTPTHGSWLNLIETFFSKLTRCLLRNLRVDSVDELKARILQGIEEINESPVIHKWQYGLDDLEVKSVPKTAPPEHHAPSNANWETVHE